MMIYWELFISFLQIGLVSFGGGYAAMAPIQAQVVDKHGWLTLAQFTDLITISQMTPGPIALNSATFVGLQVAGIPGAIVATLGNVFPSIMIVSVLAYIYFNYSKVRAIQATLDAVRPTVVALIAVAGVSIFMNAMWNGNPVSFDTLDLINAFIFIGAFMIIRKLKWDPTLVMLLTGGVGVFLVLIGVLV